MPGFDAIAPCYRWLEYGSFANRLQRCRLAQLPHLAACRRALVLGDGDGRFLLRLLQANPELRADAVDASAAMLRLLRRRIAGRRSGKPRAGALHRVRLFHADALAFVPPESGYDLVVTHFFLDCFFDRQLAALIPAIRARLAPGALWVVSEFAIPQPALPAACARLVVGGLYRAFGLLAALPVRRLPDYPAIFRANRLALRRQQTFLAGLLRAELWQLGA